MSDVTRSSDWTLLLANCLNSRIGPTYQDAGNFTPESVGRRGIFLCPDAIPPQQPSALTYYSSHPRLMPDLGINDPVPGSGRKLRPYRLARIARSSEIALVFDGSLRYTVTGVSGVWKASAVAEGFDYGRGGFSPVTINEGYLLYRFLNGAVSYLQPGTSISLKPPSSAATADLNRDTDGNWKNIRFRHIGNFRANALMADGHVETFLMRDISNSSLLRRNVYVNE